MGTVDRSGPVLRLRLSRRRLGHDRGTYLLTQWPGAPCALANTSSLQSWALPCRKYADGRLRVSATSLGTQIRFPNRLAVDAARHYAFSNSTTICVTQTSVRNWTLR